MSNEIHVGDIGTEFTITIQDGDDIVDLSTATGLVLRFKQPDCNVFERNATLLTDGADGKIFYLFAAGELSMAGEWRVQAIITLPSGTWSSSTYRFNVSQNL